MQTYVAFLRGINAGLTVKMQDLKDTFSRLGLQNIATVLATGNVIFQTNSNNIAKIETDIEKVIADQFGYKTAAIVLTKQELMELADSQPFQKIKDTSNTVRYVSLTTAQAKVDHAKYPIKGTGYTILGATNQAVYSVVDRSSATTPDLMKVLDSTYGKNITTRNWNTILKVSQRLQLEKSI